MDKTLKNIQPNREFDGAQKVKQVQLLIHRLNGLKIICRLIDRKIVLKILMYMSVCVCVCVRKREWTKGLCFFLRNRVCIHIYSIKFTFQELKRHPWTNEKLQHSPCTIILPVVLVTGGRSNLELEADLHPDDWTQAFIGTKSSMSKSTTYFVTAERPGQKKMAVGHHIVGVQGIWRLKSYQQSPHVGWRHTQKGNETTRAGGR